MIVSSRSLEMETSPIRKLIPYSLDAKNNKVKVYHLNIGQPNEVVPKEFYNGISLYEGNILGYESSNGNIELIKEIKRYYKNKNINFKDNEIFITNGGSEALNFAFFTACNSGDNVLVFEPYYANYNNLGKISGIEFNSVPTNIEEGFHLPSKDEIVKSIDSRTKAILISNPSNPTGCVYTKEELELLAEIAIEYDLWIISDEVYREFVYNGIEYVSFANFDKVKDRVIIIDSISKRYSACGARIGNIACKNVKFNKQILKLCQSRLSVATLEQAGAINLYKVSEDYIKKIISKYEKRKNIVVKKLNEIDGVSCNNPEGAFYIIAKLPVDDAEEFCIWLLEKFNDNNETIMLCPANGFYKNGISGRNEVRITYVQDEKDLNRSIEILKKALIVYKK